MVLDQHEFLQVDSRPHLSLSPRLGPIRARRPWELVPSRCSNNQSVYATSRVCVCLKCIRKDPGSPEAEDASAAASYYHPRRKILFRFSPNFSCVLRPLHPSSSENCGSLWLRVIRILPLSVSVNLSYRSARLKSPSFPTG